MMIAKFMTIRTPLTAKTTKMISLPRAMLFRTAADMEVIPAWTKRHGTTKLLRRGYPRMSQ